MKQRPRLIGNTEREVVRQLDGRFTRLERAHMILPTKNIIEDFTHSAKHQPTSLPIFAPQSFPTQPQIFLYYMRLNGSFELVKLDPSSGTETVLFTNPSTGPLGITDYLVRAPDGYFYGRDSYNLSVASSPDAINWVDSISNPTDIDSVYDLATSIDSAIWFGAYAPSPSFNFNIYKSTDHLATFFSVVDINIAGYDPTVFNTRWCAANPIDANGFVALVTNGSLSYLAVTINGGSSWTYNLISPSSGHLGFVTDIAWLNDGSIIVAGLINLISDAQDHAVILRTTDLGVTWSTFDYTVGAFAQGMTQSIPTIIPKQKASSQTMFVISSFEDSSTALYRKCWRSIDNGITWTDIGWPNNTNIWVFDSFYDQVNDVLYVWFSGNTPNWAIYKIDNATTNTTWFKIIDESNLQAPSMTL